MSATDQVIIKILAEDVNFKKEIKEIDKEIKKATKAAEAAAKKLAVEQEKQAAKVKKAWETIGTSMVVVGTAAATALGFIVKSAVDFEAAFAGVEKTVEGTPEQLQQVNDQIRDMAKVMPMTTTEISKIAELGGQLGVPIDKLSHFTDVMARYSTTQDRLDHEQAALGFAQFMNVMEGGTDNIERAVSSMVNLSNKTATTDDKILALGKRLAPTASIIGMTTDSTLGLAAAITSLGIEPEAAGTAMQNVMMQMDIASKGLGDTTIDNTSKMEKLTSSMESNNIALQKKTNRLRELEAAGKQGSATYKNLEIDIQNLNSKISQGDSQMAEYQRTQGQLVVSQNAFATVLGVTNEEFTAMWENNPSETVLKLLESMKKMSDEGQNLIPVLEEMDADQARSIRTLLSQVEGFEKVKEAMDVAKVGYEDVSILDQEYQRRLETTQAQMQVFRNNINDVSISLGNALLPAINSIIEALVPLIDKFGDFADEHPRVVIGILGVIAVIGSLSGAIMVLTPVISALGTIMAAVIGPTAMAAITGGLTVFAGVFGSIVGVVTLVVGVFSLVTLAFDELFYQLGITGERMEFVRDLFSTSKIIFEELGSKASDLAGKLFGISGATRDIKLSEEELQNARDNRKSLENEMLTAMENTQLLRIRAKEATDAVTEAEEKYGEGSDEYIKAVINRDRTIRELEQSYIDSNKKIDEFNENEEKIIDNKDPVVDSVESGGNAADNAKGKWSSLAAEIGKAAANLANYAGQKVGEFVGGQFKTENREHGGIVPGPIGAPVPMIAHGGERITPRTGVDVNQGGGNSGGGISITFNGPVNMDSDDRVNQLAKMIEQRLGRQSELSQFGVALN